MAIVMEKQVLGWLYWLMNDSNFCMKIKTSVIQLFRYGLVGIASNLSGYVLYLLLTYLGSTPKITMSFLYVMGAVIGFWGNRKFAFAHTGSLFGSGVRYAISHCIGFLLNLVILIVMVDKMGYAHQWVQAVAIFVVAGFLFLAFKFFVFKSIDDSQKRKE